MQSFSFLILFWGIFIKMINLVLCGRKIEHNVHHLIFTGTFIYIFHILAHRKKLKTLHQKMLPHTLLLHKIKQIFIKKNSYLLFNMYMYILLILLWFKEKHNILSNFRLSNFSCKSHYFAGLEVLPPWAFVIFERLA